MQDRDTRGRHAAELVGAPFQQQGHQPLQTRVVTDQQHGGGIQMIVQQGQQLARRGLVDFRSDDDLDGSQLRLDQGQGFAGAGGIANDGFQTSLDNTGMNKKV